MSTLIKDEKQGLIFIPLLSKEGEILDYTYTEIEYYDMLQGQKLRLKIKNGKKYAANSKNLMMQVLIFGRKANPGFLIDHKNSNGLDNRRSNLREVTYPQNAHNRLKKKGESSEYIGVTKCKRSNKWVSQIRYKREKYHLGTFETESEAAIIRDIYAVYYYREAANLNIDSSGSYLINKEMISNILEEGIPEKYKIIKKKKTNDLPQHVYIQGEKYFYRISYKSKKYRKSFDTLDETVTELNKLKMELARTDEIERLEKENNIIRNKDGVAIIKAKYIGRDEYDDFMIDDICYKYLCHTSWLISRPGYPGGSLDGYQALMHLHIYKKFVGPVPEGKTIDHANTNKNDCRLANLRPNTSSGQNHNKDAPKQSCLKYRGVVLINGSFYTGYKGKSWGPYKTEEESAEVYNKLAIEEYGSFAKINEIVTSNTTVDKYFSISMIDIDFVKNIKTVGEMKTLFKVNPCLCPKGIYFSKVRKDNMEQYRELAIHYFMNKM